VRNNARPYFKGEFLFYKEKPQKLYKNCQTNPEPWQYYIKIAKQTRNRGNKKGGNAMCKHDLDGKYIPQNFEDELYKEWEDKGYFKPSMDKNKKPYCIMMPPPNVTRKVTYGTCFR